MVKWKTKRILIFAIHKLSRTSSVESKQMYLYVTYIPPTLTKDFKFKLHFIVLLIDLLDVHEPELIVNISDCQALARTEPKQMCTATVRNFFCYF